MNSTVSPKGQVVIPANLRLKFGIQAGTKVCFEERDGVIAMMPVCLLAERSMGMFKSKGKPASRYLQEVREEERAYEKPRPPSGGNR
jgi:AbrB family looped-hinge helix DNA binding protein